MDPERFAKMIVGDFLDAMGGYNEAEAERIRAITEVMRISTTLAVNIHLAKDDKITAAELWPLPWDNEGEPAVKEEVSEEEQKKLEEKHKNILDKMNP